ncbi:HD-GYP domain-containing protein [Paraburkholderia kururiensis]|uniref:HD-GYP domain-containing protein n=1 Tax=Paraburkholderia kururiensis TaxID=984307 RepID=A0ABZ0WRU5_9BURK|nr:HD-GYP domain-containing protein [Paraburkholderia kururiensis]WQD80066.1 HD-GYP domain-containing protein [Paraburkholderia kururiensis]
MNRALLVALDERDGETSGHCLRVGLLAESLGRALGVRDADLVMLREAGFAHDIGKIAIPDRVLFKPGALDDTEFQLIQTHSAIGKRILSSQNQQDGSNERIADAVLHHHERYDGTGYPSGLKATGIPFWSRIIAVADCFDALTMTRPYHDAMPAASAIDLIAASSGTHFDPDVVSAFVALQRG